MGAGANCWAPAGPAAHRRKAAASGISLRAVTGDLLVSDNDSIGVLRYLFDRERMVGKGRAATCPARVVGAGAKTVITATVTKGLRVELAQVDLALQPAYHA